MPYVNSTRTVDNGVGVDIALAGAGNLFVASGLLSAQKSITLSDGFLNNGAPEENLIIPVLFPNGHNDLGPSLHASLAVMGVSNPIPIVSNQRGTLKPLPNHQMTEGGSTVYKSIQPNTILSMYYTADYDGSQNPAFVIVGTPVVLSSADYTIYANGWIKQWGEIINTPKVDLYVPFTSLDYYCNAIAYNSSDTIGVYIKTLSSFNLTRTATYFWVAQGY